MDKKDIVFGLVIILILTAVVYYWKKPPAVEQDLVVPQTLSVEDEIEEKFKIQIPEDVEKAELKDVSGGDGSGIATRKFAEGEFSHTILVDLPDPEGIRFYEGWLVKDNETVSTGKLNLAKGGYLLEFQSDTDYTSFNQVVVTLEEKLDKTSEKHILEGSF
ncbi:hypothetical protein A2Z22_04845 [Candidatus Woesebacteria bacterium RBG_16_34_12]|uniref:Anti-sigma factor n=1 Tax=Candidatus Woesebacteria bacterium RBG_16_34_12 TaxID=1802480 RepID=A0A1F7XAC1_9BACT|nr:MAG: hypothetical protein A2Z22_04845 [Candidatus Woesebacteria bacterium RBG_16_34_12]